LDTVQVATKLEYEVDLKQSKAVRT